MKQFLWLLVSGVFLSLVVDASSDDRDRNVKLEINVNERNPDGSYFYEYLLGNGASQKVTATLKDVNGQKVYSVEGSYNYEKDGEGVYVYYIADENGYRILPPGIIYSSSGISAIGFKTISSLLG